MNSETGEVKYFEEGEEVKPPWLLIKNPDPKCGRCKGRGSILVRPMEYIPCPDCAGKKGGI